MVKLSPTLRRAVIKQNFTKIRRIIEAKKTSETRYFHELVNEVLRQFIKRQSQAIVIDPNIVHYLLWAGASPAPYIYSAVYRVTDFPTTPYMMNSLSMPYLEAWAFGKNEHIFEFNRQFLSLFPYSTASLHSWKLQLEVREKKSRGLEDKLEGYILHKDRAKKEWLLYTLITETEFLLSDCLNKARHLSQRIKSMETHATKATEHEQKLLTQDDFQDKVMHFLRFVLQFNELGREQLGFIPQIEALFANLSAWYKNYQNPIVIEKKLLEFVRFLDSIPNRGLPEFSEKYLPSVLTHIATLRRERELALKLRNFDQLAPGQTPNRIMMSEQIEKFSQMSDKHAVVHYFNQDFIPYIPPSQRVYYLHRAMTLEYDNLAIRMVPYVLGQEVYNPRQSTSFALQQAIILMQFESYPNVLQIEPAFIFTPPTLPTPPEKPANYWKIRWQQVRQKWLSQVVNWRDIYFFSTIQADPLMLFYDNGVPRLRKYLNIAAQLSPHMLSRLNIDKSLSLMVYNFAIFASNSTLNPLPLDVQRQIASFLPRDFAKNIGHDGWIATNKARARIIFHSMHLINIFSVRQFVHRDDLEKIAIALIRGESQMTNIRVSDRHFSHVLRRFLISHVAIQVSRDRAKIAAFHQQKIKILADLISLGVSKECLLWEAIQVPHGPLVSFFIQQQANLFWSPTNDTFARLMVACILRNQLPFALLKECRERFAESHSFLAWLDEKNQAGCSALDLIVSSRNQVMLSWITVFLQHEASDLPPLHEVRLKVASVTQIKSSQGYFFWHCLAQAIGQKKISQATIVFCLLNAWHHLQACFVQKNAAQETFFDILQNYQSPLVQSLRTLAAKRSPRSFLQLAMRSNFPITAICHILTKFSYREIYYGDLLSLAFEAATRDKAYAAVLVTLLNKGAPFTDRVTFGHILQLAIKIEHSELLNIPAMCLFVSGDSHNNTALHFAVETCNVQLANYLHMKYPRLLNQANDNGDTPLHKAIKRRQLKPLLWFCERGADLGLKNKSGKTAAALLLDHLDELAAQVQQERAPRSTLQHILLEAVGKKIGSDSIKNITWSMIIETLDAKCWTPRFQQQATHPYVKALQALGILAYLKNRKLRNFLTEAEHTDLFYETADIKYTV